MKLKLFLTAKGNSSLLIWNCPKNKKAEIINKYLGKEAEQIAFISSGKIPTLSMMGGELCINSTLALAGYLGKNGFLLASGVNGLVSYRSLGNKASITLPLPFRQMENIVLFEGIGFICRKSKLKPTKKELINLCNKYNLPAFGIILYQGNKSTPFIYVKETDSLTAETACGSGSIALSIVAGFKNIIQPTGEIISVTQKNNLFQVEAYIEQISLKGGDKK